MSASASLDFCRSFEREFQRKHRTADAQALAWPGGGGAYMTTVTLNSQLGSVKPCISHGKTIKRKPSRCACTAALLCSRPPLGAFLCSPNWSCGHKPTAAPRGLEAIPSSPASRHAERSFALCWRNRLRSRECQILGAKGRPQMAPRCVRTTRPTVCVLRPSGAARAPAAPLCPLQACLHPKCALVLPCACAPGGFGG